MAGALLALLVGVVEITSGGFGIYDHIKPFLDTIYPPSPLATPLAFATETPDETLIVVAPFTRALGMPDSRPHEKIADAIRSAIDSLKLADARVEVATDLESITTYDQAEALGKQYRASSVIWGEESSVDIKVNILNRRKLYNSVRVSPGENGLMVASSQAYLNPDQFSDPKIDVFDSPLPGISVRPNGPPYLSPLLVVPEKVPVVKTDNTYVTTNAEPKNYIKLITVDLPQEVTFFALIPLAQVQIYKGNNQAAVDLLEKALSARRTVAANDDIGEIYRETGRLHLMVDSKPFEAADPICEPVSQAHAESAIKRLNEAVAAGSDEPLTHYLLGIAYMDAQNFTSALTAFNKSIEEGASDKLRPYILYVRAQAKANLHDNNGSLDDLNQVLVYMPDATGVHYVRSQVHFDQKDYTGVLSDVESFYKYLGRDAFIPEILETKGKAYMGLKQYRNAVDTFQSLVNGLKQNYSSYDRFYQEELLKDAKEHANAAN